MIGFLVLLFSCSFCKTHNIKDEYNEYVCFQGGNALCPSDHNYQVFNDHQKLTNYLLNNVNNKNDTFTIFVANTKQDILFLNCSMLPNKINIDGYSDSYANIDFSYSYGPDKSKRKQIITVNNLKVQSIRAESKKDQNKIKTVFLNLTNVTFLNQQLLKIEAKEISATFNSLQRVQKVKGDKIVRLSGIPKGHNNGDLHLTVSIEADKLILDSFNDNASVDFISKEKSDDLSALLQFDSFKSSVITLYAEKYNIFLNYNTCLTFYYDSPDHSKIVSLSKDVTKVNINVESENARVLFSSDKWSNNKVHKDNHHEKDHEFDSIDFDLTCASNVTVESSSQYLPLTVSSCKNPHLIFNDLSASIDSLELIDDGNAIIENLQNGGEVILNHHITFSPGAHLQVLDSVSKMRVKHIKSELRSLPTQMTVSGHFETDESEFEFLQYSVSFEYLPFSSNNDEISCFVVPVDRTPLMPIEIRQRTENKINIRLSNDFLKSKYNDQISSQIINKNINLFVNMKVEDFNLYFRPNKPSKHHKQTGWNLQQQGLFSLHQNGQFVSLTVSDLPSLYTSSICVYKEDDEHSKEICAREEVTSFSVPKKSSSILEQNSYYAKVSDMTRSKSDVTIYISSPTDITLNLDDLESASVQSISDDEKSSVTIDNNRQNAIKSLSLKDIKVTFSDKSLHYDHLTLDHGTKLEESNRISFNKVEKLNADVTILKDIPKNRLKTNSVIFGNVVQTIKFIENGFVFLLIHDNEFEIDYEDYNTDDYPFVFNESNITLVKEYYKPSHFVLPLNYEEFDNNSNNYIIVDSSFNNDNALLDIEIKGEKVKLLTYSSVIPFKFSSEVELIKIGLGKYDNVRAIDFVDELEIEKNSVLTVSTISEEDDRLLKEHLIHINFNEIELENNASLISKSDIILFTKLSVEENAAVNLVGVTVNGPIELEGIATFVNVSCDPSSKRPSNLATSMVSLKVEEDLFDLLNSPRNSPLFKFDLESIDKPFKSLIIHFEKYDHSLLNFNKTSKIANLVEVEKPFAEFRCTYVASRVTFQPSTLRLSVNESITLSAVCDSEENVVVHGEINDHKPEDPTPSVPGSGDGDDGDDGDDDDKNSGINGKSKKKRNRIIAIACACGSAVIIFAVAVSVALYLKKHYKEGDSEKAQMMEHLDPNNEENSVII